MRIKNKISIVLPVFNAESYVEDCLKSILSQTMQDFELIAIDDGSTDKSLGILNKYSKKISNMFIISRENRGLIASLNEAISVSSGKYICRMDADDIMSPLRLEKQYEFLENHLDYIACGTGYQCFGKSNKKVMMPSFETSKDALIYMLFENPFAHPTMMVNKELLGNIRYDDQHLSCEDYGLWMKLLLGGHKITNLQEVLCYYRVHDQQISIIKQYEQNINVAKLSLLILKSFNYEISSDILLCVQRPQYAVEFHKNNILQIEDFLNFIFPLINNKAIFYKHLAEYCHLSDGGYRMYGKYLNIKCINLFFSHLPLVVCKKSSLINLMKRVKIR